MWITTPSFLVCWFTARAWSYRWASGGPTRWPSIVSETEWLPCGSFTLCSRAPSGTVQRWRSRTFAQLRMPYPSWRPTLAVRRPRASRWSSRAGGPSDTSRRRIPFRRPVRGTRGPDSPPKPPGVHSGPLSLACFHSTTSEGCQAMLKMQIAVGLAVKITTQSSPQTTPGTTLR